MQAKLVSMAMAEAGKLFDAGSGGGGGSKQDAMSGAAMNVGKLLLQSGNSSQVTDLLGKVGLSKMQIMEMVSAPCVVPRKHNRNQLLSRGPNI